MDARQWMSILLFLAAALMAFIAYLSYLKRHLPAAKTLILIMLAASFYATGYAFEVLSDSLGEVKLSLQIEYVGIPFVSALWLYQIIQFTGTAAAYRKRLALALCVVPASVFLVQLTNDWHHLMYERFIPTTDDAIVKYVTVKGLWYKVHTVYSYIVMTAGLSLCIRMYWRALPIVRKQIAVLLLGAIAPMLFNLCLWFGIDVDLTPFGFAVSGIAYIWGIFKFNLLRLMPLAQAQVFDTIGDGVVLLDYENQIVSFNRAAEEVLPELSLTKRYPASAGSVLSGSPELLERIGSNASEEERFPYQELLGGRNRHYACRLSFIYDASKIPIGKMLMFNDITELKENEDRLRENARQLSELNAFKDKLFTVMAHDIRDPIALLVSLTELLGDELADADAEHAELFRELKGQVQSTFLLVDNLLDWYRSQKGKIAFSPAGWNVLQVVRQALTLAGSKAGMKQIRMTERVERELTISADKEMLDLILRNLLSNAIKYTGIGGSIEVSAALDGDWVVVRVTDDGAGIDEGTAELLRREEPFFNLPAMGGDDSGDARFGLVLTREFVRIHGGKLWFESAAGEGTSFFFTLPGSAGGQRAFEDDGEAAGPAERRVAESA